MNKTVKNADLVLSGSGDPIGGHSRLKNVIALSGRLQDSEAVTVTGTAELDMSISSQKGVHCGLPVCQTDLLYPTTCNRSIFQFLNNK